METIAISDKFYMKAQPLKASTTHLQVLPWKKVVTYGLSLHFAIILGSLRKNSRYQGHHAIIHSIKRFINEYGMYLMLLGALQLAVTTVELPAVARLCAVLALPLITVLQVVTDKIRGLCEVYYDPEHNVGLTIKQVPQGTAFYNHFALPIGRKHGKGMRQDLHSLARTREDILLCRAQNVEVGNYYKTEYPDCLMSSEKKPTLIWNYSSRSAPVVSVPQKKWDIFGFNSTRDTGRLR